jgi:hypothetical protein
MSCKKYKAGNVITGYGRKPHTYIINEAYEDRYAGTFKTFEAACKAMKRYTEEELEILSPAIGRVLENGEITYEI